MKNQRTFVQTFVEVERFKKMDVLSKVSAKGPVPPAASNLSPLSWFRLVTPGEPVDSRHEYFLAHFDEPLTLAHIHEQPLAY